MLIICRERENTQMEKEDYRSDIYYGAESYPFIIYQDEKGHYKNGTIGWHWHNEVEFIYVLSGKVLCSVGGESRLLEEGSGVFINQDILHRFMIYPNGKMYSVIFKPAFLAAPRTSVYDDYVKPILESRLYFQFLNGNDPKQRSIISKIIETGKAAGENSKLARLNTYIQALELWRALYLLNVSDRVGKGESGFLKTQKRTKQMICFIEHHYSESISVGEIAAAANISGTEASRCFRELMKISSLQYLNQFRLEKAMELLLTTDKSINEIAEETGFSSNTYFTRMFRRMYHCTLIEVRKTQGIM